MIRGIAVLGLSAALSGLACAGIGASRSPVAVLPSGATFQLEIADEPEETRRGYGFRDEVGPHEGMLFVFEDDRRRPFWMKDCKVSLDIIWLDRNLRVVHIAHDRPPCPADGDCPLIVPPRKARYVLEVAGGISESEGLRIGDRIEVLGDPLPF